MFAHVIMPGTATTVQIYVKIGSVGASPQTGEILRLSDFLTAMPCLVLFFFSRARAQVEPLDRFSRFMAQTTCFRARRCLLGVTTIDDVIWGNVCPQNPPKSGRE